MKKADRQQRGSEAARPYAGRQETGQNEGGQRIKRACIDAQKRNTVHRDRMIKARTVMIKKEGRKNRQRIEGDLEKPEAEGCDY